MTDCYSIVTILIQEIGPQVEAHCGLVAEIQKKNVRSTVREWWDDDLQFSV